MRAQRVPDRDIETVLDTLQDDLARYYRDTYGTEAEAGDAEAEMFHGDRGGLVAVYDTTVPVAMAGWTDIARLGYTPLQLPDGPLPRTAEIKRVYVHSDYRGRGLSTLVEERMHEEMFTRAHLARALGETGPAQVVSQRIHSRPPYRITAPFGHFHDNPGSLFFEVTAESWAQHRQATQTQIQTRTAGEEQTA